MAVNYLSPLEPGCFYHIFNQGNDDTNIFYKPANYEYFLKKFDNYISDFADTFCFCLMPNHFHFLIRIKDSDVLAETLKKTNYAGKVNVSNISEFLSEQFRRFFMSYSKAINKQQERRGSLFRKNFKRKKVTCLRYLQQVAYYIHRNPVHHGFTDDFRMYPWSSYDRILAERISKLRKQDVIGWFEDKEKYIHFHNKERPVEDELCIE